MSATAFLESIDLSDRTVIVTGGTSGIGKATVLSLARAGTKVIVPFRSAEKARLLKEQAQQNDLRIDLRYCDLCRLSTVREFAARILDDKVPIDSLILNAGVEALDYQRTEDDLEVTFQTNHLAQFLLCVLLRPALAQNARVVFVASEMHRGLWNMVVSAPLLLFGRSFDLFPSPIPPNVTAADLSPPRERYSKMQAYNLTKFLNVLTAKCLDRVWGIRCIAVHPGGLVNTGICRHSALLTALHWLARPFVKSLDEAAATSVYAAVTHSLAGGSYLVDCQPIAAHRDCSNIELQNRIYNISMSLLQQP